MMGSRGSVFILIGEQKSSLVWVARSLALFMSTPHTSQGKKLEFEGRKLGKLLFTVQEGWEGTKAFGRIQQVLT